MLRFVMAAGFSLSMHRWRRVGGYETLAPKPATVSRLHPWARRGGEPRHFPINCVLHCICSGPRGLNLRQSEPVLCQFEPGLRHFETDIENWRPETGPRN